MLFATVTNVADVLFVTTAWFGKGLAGLAFLKVFTAFANKEQNVVIVKTQGATVCTRLFILVTLHTLLCNKRQIEFGTCAHQ